VVSGPGSRVAKDFLDPILKAVEGALSNLVETFENFVRTLVQKVGEAIDNVLDPLPCVADGYTASVGMCRCGEDKFMDLAPRCNDPIFHHGEAYCRNRACSRNPTRTAPAITGGFNGNSHRDNGALGDESDTSTASTLSPKDRLKQLGYGKTTPAPVATTTTTTTTTTTPSPALDITDSGRCDGMLELPARIRKAIEGQTASGACAHPIDRKSRDDDPDGCVSAHRPDKNHEHNSGEHTDAVSGTVTTLKDNDGKDYFGTTKSSGWITVPGTMNPDPFNTGQLSTSRCSRSPLPDSSMWTSEHKVDQLPEEGIKWQEWEDQQERWQAYCAAQAQQCLTQEYKARDTSCVGLSDDCEPVHLSVEHQRHECEQTWARETKTNAYGGKTQDEALAHGGTRLGYGWATKDMKVHVPQYQKDEAEITACFGSGTDGEKVHLGFEQGVQVLLVPGVNTDGDSRRAFSQAPLDLEITGLHSPFHRWDVPRKGLSYVSHTHARTHASTHARTHARAHHTAAYACKQASYHTVAGPLQFMHTECVHSQRMMTVFL
jgi:hypothetical protein